MDACGTRSALGIAVTRKITNKGIRILGNYYRPLLEAGELGHEFLHSRNRNVTVRVDTDNLGAVSVQIAGKFVDIPCSDLGMEGVSAADWIATGNALRRKHSKPRPIVEFPEPLWTQWEEPETFVGTTPMPLS
jgi:hypothetical protein